MDADFPIWRLILVLLTFLSLLVACVSLLIRQFERHLDDRFLAQEATRKANHDATQTRLEKLETAAGNEYGQWQRAEREILQLKADLPLHYVRREDYVQSVATIMAKLDAITLRFENILLTRGGKSNE